MTVSMMASLPANDFTWVVNFGVVGKDLANHVSPGDLVFCVYVDLGGATADGILDIGSRYACAAMQNQWHPVSSLTCNISSKPRFGRPLYGP